MKIMAHSMGIPYTRKKYVYKASCRTPATYLKILSMSLAFLSPVRVSGQTISSSTISNGQSVCPGEFVHFTCTTRGSRLITWRVPVYFDDSHFLLQFAAIDPEGHSLHSTNDPNLFANLTRNVMENESQVLESQIHIQIRPDHPSPTLICAHENGCTDSITLRVLVAPDKVDVVSDQRRNTTAGGCVVHFSWTLPSNVAVGDLKHFMIFFNGKHIGNQTIINTSVAMKAHPVCTCGTHNISITTINRCDLKGQSKVYNVEDPDQEPLPDAMCANADLNMKPMNSSLNPADGNEGFKPALITVSVLFGVSLVLLIVLILMLLGVIPKPTCKWPCGGKNKKTS